MSTQYINLSNNTLNSKSHQVFQGPKGLKLEDYKKGKLLLSKGVTKSFQEAFEESLSKESIDATQGIEKNGVKGSLYVVKPGDTLWDISKNFKVNLEDLIRDNNIQNPELIYPGQELFIRKNNHPLEQVVVASWYGPGYHGRPMANGEKFNMYDMVVAHKELPFGTKVEILNPENNKRVVAVVKDRGPFIAGRDLDLSYGIAKRLGMVEKGVGKVVMRILA